MPDYSGQLARARNKDRTKLKGSVKKKIAQAVVQRMLKAVEDKESWVWPFAFALAAMSDLGDFIPFFSVGGFVDILTSIILTLFLIGIGGFIKWKVRIAIWLAGFLEAFSGIIVVLSLLGVFPTHIICILYAHHVIKKRAAIAEKGLASLKRGKTNREAIQEFS